MKRLRSMWGIARMELYALLRDERVLVVLLLAAVSELRYVQNIFDYAKEISIPSTPWLLPLMLTDPSTRFVILGGAALLFVSAFRKGPEAPYLTVRGWRSGIAAGRRSKAARRACWRRRHPTRWTSS